MGEPQVTSLSSPCTGRAGYLKKGRHILCKAVRVKYAFKEAWKERHGLVLLCRLFGVHRSSFYAWRHHPESKRSIEDRHLLGLNIASFEASQGIYGGNRIFCDLREVGEACGVQGVARIMRAHKIAALRGYKSHRFHYRKPTQAAPNRLSQQFSMQMPDEAWLTDITYIRTS